MGRADRLGLEPRVDNIDGVDDFPLEGVVAVSQAISLKRIADALMILVKSSEATRDAVQSLPSAISTAIDTGIRDGANTANDILFNTLRR